MPPLHVLRSAQQMTQGQLAYRTSLARETIANIEASQHRPRWRTIRRIAAVLGVAPETIDEFRALFAPSTPKASSTP
jgi:DNA-binding XRE family transcriptional regulator